MSNGTATAPDWLRAMAYDKTTPLYVNFFFSVPCALLYAAEMVPILVKPTNDFRSAFFRIFAARTFVDLTNYLDTFIHFRFGHLGRFLAVYLALPSPVLAFIHFYNYYAFSAQNVATVFLSLNRFTALFRPSEHDKIWRKLLPFAITGIFFIPLLYTAQITLRPSYMKVSENSSAFTIEEVERVAGSLASNDSLLAVISGITYMILAVGVNIAVVLKFRRHRRQQTQNRDSHANEAVTSRQATIESRLTVYMLLTFVGHLVHTGYLALVYVFGFTLPSPGLPATTATLIYFALCNQMAWVGDLCTVSLPALLMLWASADMRRALWKPIRRLIGGVRWLRDVVCSGGAAVGPSSSLMPTSTDPNQQHKEQQPGQQSTRATHQPPRRVNAAAI